MKMGQPDFHQTFGFLLHAIGFDPRAGGHLDDFLRTGIEVRHPTPAPWCRGPGPGSKGPYWRQCLQGPHSPKRPRHPDPGGGPSLRMGEEPGVRHTFDTGDVPYRTPRLGGVVFADYVAFDIDLDKATRRREVLCAQIGDQQIIVGQLDDVIDPGKFFDLRRSRYQEGELEYAADQ